MDKILIGLINSEQPIAVKKSVVTQIANYGQQNTDEELFKKILKCCLGVLLPAQDENVADKNLVIQDLLKHVVKMWVKSNGLFSRQFINTEILNKPLHSFDKEEDQISLLRHLKFLLDIFYSGIPFNNKENKSFNSILKGYLYASLLKTENVKALSLLCKCSMTYQFLMSQNLSRENKDDILGIIVNILSTTPITYFLRQADPAEFEYQHIDNLLSKLINDKETMEIVGNHIFKRLSAEGPQPSPCIALILVHLKLEFLSNSIEQLMTMNLQDETLTKILSSMIDWIFVPNPKISADQWIIHHMKCLIKYSKYQILFVVIEAKIKQIFNFVFIPILRKSAISLAIFMLISYLHSPKPFHQISGTIPNLIIHLKKESEENESYIKMLVELTFTLMYLFPGFPDIYGPLLEVLKEYPKPPEERMKTWLQASFSIPTVDQAVLTTPEERKSLTGKVGLVNLGNTCYANSIIQALFNLKKIKKLLLEEDNAEPVEVLTLTTSFKELFALLHMSKRPSVAPKAFLDLSRPPWFQKGFQQDCSEYLKFLLDKLQTESRSVGACDINKLVTGKMKTSVVCSNCGTVSDREELFNDLPLSFHEVLEGVDHTLKGGDPSDTLKRKMKCNLSGAKRDTVGQTPTESEVDISLSQSSGGGESSQSSPNLSIKDMLHNYLSPEHLEESNQYFCEKCAALQNAVKTIEITEFPAYLILTIKRFTYNVATQKRSKLLHVVRHPQTFFICSGCTRCRQNRTEKPSPRHYDDNDGGRNDNNEQSNCENVQQFRLSSFIVHSGYSSESGHYYSYACEYDDVTGDNNSNNTVKCFLMNDSRVTASSLDSISNLSTTFPRDTPYIYIYEKFSGETAADSDFEVRRRLIEYVQNDDAIYEMELQRNAVRRQKSFLCSRDNKRNDGDDDDGGSFSSGSGNCGPSMMGFEPNRFIF